MAIRCCSGTPAAILHWYEGYLVPSRSTGVRPFGEDADFWVNLEAQALATLWILQLTLRALNLAQLFRLLAISLSLILTTALPWLSSLLADGYFRGAVVA